MELLRGHVRSQRGCHEAVPFQIALEQNEAALSVALVKFSSHPDELYVVVGAARELSLQPWQARGGGLLLTYRLTHAGNESKLELVHATPVEEAPTALCPFQGRLLAGVGKCLRLYDLGRKKLLRKCENKVSGSEACCSCATTVGRKYHPHQASTLRPPLALVAYGHIHIASVRGVDRMAST